MDCEAVYGRGSQPRAVSDGPRGAWSQELESPEEAVSANRTGRPQLHGTAG